MSYKKMQIISLFLLMCGTTTPLLAESKAEPFLKLPSIFGNHMVLQQGRDIPVWGWAEPGGSVQVTLGSHSVQTKADASGKWMARLPPLPASKDPVEMSVESGGKVLSYMDVLLGDVWLCSGQSNMGMGVGLMRNAEALVATANRPTMRLFAVSRQVGFSPLEDCEGTWVICTPESVLTTGGGRGFSAVGYQFGAELQDRLHRPVGLIYSTVGGTTIHAWSSLDSLKSQPREMRSTFSAVQQIEQAINDLPAAMKLHAEVLLPAWEKEHEERQRPLQEWRQAVAEAREQGVEPPPRPQLKEISGRPREPDRRHTLPTVLYNGMIAPLAPYGVSGVIWYQGETDAYPARAKEYAVLFKELITDWRRLWARADLPFLYVQLPNMKSPQDWPLVREAQRQALELPFTAMAVGIDAGDPDDLHPADKTVIAGRLVLAARRVAYGEDLVHSGPLHSGIRADGQHLYLSFENTGGGLMIGGAPSPWHQPLTARPAERLQGFEIAGADGVYHSSEAEIVGQQVRAWSETVTAPLSVRYAWAPDPDPFANLYNREGLPASPFEITIRP